MSERKLGWMAIFAVALFWAALFLFGSLRSGYSQTANAVSELGALNTPLMLAWNVVGFGLPGLLLMIFGWRLGRIETPRAWFVPGMLACSLASSRPICGTCAAQRRNSTSWLPCWASSGCQACCYTRGDATATGGRRAW